MTIPERPGSFRAFCEALGRRQITEFNYRYHTDREAHIFVGVQTHPENDPRAALVQGLRDKGFPVLDLTDNELAKLHTRHMVGGHAAGVSDEMVLRFEFPERPGALFNFLNKLGGRWNISMFHYRNHGADFGRADAGVDMTFDFGTLVAHAAKTRALGAGTIVGSGTVSNRDADGGPGKPIAQGGVGYSCLAEVRTVETIASGKATTPFLKRGDTVRIWAEDDRHHPIFGVIEQTVE